MHSQTTAPAVVIGGPTASGKSALAIRLAREVGGEIINADAFQLYRGLPLLTAQPTPQELVTTPHQLVGEFEPSELFDAARYLKTARERITRSWDSGHLPILVGGTGLYIRAVLYGLSTGLPAPDAALRVTLETQPLEDLQRKLLDADPQAAQWVDLRNPRRVIRALEVCLLTGRPFTSFRDPAPVERPLVGLWLSLPREVLHRKIEMRAGLLFKNGVEQEVANVLPRLGQSAGQAIGLKAVSEVLEGKSSPENAIQTIIHATRQYARRQETWFRKEPGLHPQSPENALAFCMHLLKRRSH